MGKPDTEWSKGKHCTRCGFYKSDGHTKDKSRLGVCTRFNIDVVDCLCGCRKREEGGIILMNFDDNALAKAVNNIKKSFPDV